MSRLSIFAAALASIALVSTALAAPVAYDEAVTGDLPDADPLPNFAFDLGVNTVSGTAGKDFFDFDDFAFTIASGQQVTAATVSLVDTTGDLTEIDWGAYKGSALVFGGTKLEELNVPSPGLVTFTTTPFNPDVYNVSMDSISSLPNGTAGTSSYTFSFTVANIVPEPTTLALLALSSLALMRRSRRATHSS
jgi:hypothetical protein